MSYSDFCLCYPDEFDAICKAWQDMRAATTQDEWERTRMLATITIQPHVRSKITAQRLLPLPWDKKKNTTPKEVDEPPMSKEERRERMERMARMLQD